MSKERRCFICGTHYKWCNTCHDFDPTESWKYLYHDEDCLAISRIWYAYRGNEISKEEAKRRMDFYPDIIAMVLNNDSTPAKEIQEIYKVQIPENVEEEKVETNASNENVAEETPVIEQAKKPIRKSSANKNNKK